MFILRDAIVHSSAGIIALDGDVVSETLAHTLADAQNYDLDPGGVELRTGPIMQLPGTHITLLAGGIRNYFHATVESTLRLAMVPLGELEGASTLLVPADASGQSDMLDLLDLPPGLHRREVTDCETLRVERLVFPWTIHGHSSYHPCVSAFFDRISAKVQDGDREFPTRIYIDRRGAALRPLLNEAEIVTCLAPFGFVPVDPGRLSVADQVRLFRNAEAIVAPHGAALTNLGFCRAGCRVLELLMDTYVNWCFRHLGALRDLRYDCVIGRAIPSPLETLSSVHEAKWRISATHVAAAAACLLET